MADDNDPAAIRRAALEEAARVALRCAVSRDPDCRELQQHIATAIRALAKKEPTDADSP